MEIKDLIIKYNKLIINNKIGIEKIIKVDNDDLNTLHDLSILSIKNDVLETVIEDLEISSGVKYDFNIQFTLTTEIEGLNDTMSESIEVEINYSNESDRDYDYNEISTHINKNNNWDSVIDILEQHTEFNPSTMSFYIADLIKENYKIKNEKK